MTGDKIKDRLLSMKKNLAFIVILGLSLPFFALESEALQSDSAVQNRGFLGSVADFVTTAPYLLNIGCEPSENHGAKTFGSFEYKWTPDFSSQIYFEKGSDLAFEEHYSDDTGDSTFLTDTNVYFCKVFPYKKYINSRIDNSFNFSISLGLAGELLNARMKSNEILSNHTYDGDYPNGPYYPGVDIWFFANYKSSAKETDFIIGPCIDFDFSFPLTSWLSFNAENSIIPVYFYNLNLTHSYSYVGWMDSPEQQFSDHAFATGIAKLKCHLDFFKKVGIVVNYEFSQLVDYDISFDSSGILCADRYMKTTNTLRFGGALLQTTDTFVRIQTGFYREYLWTKSAASQDSVFSQSWVLSVSVGF